MNANEHLLQCLSEECSEVAHRVSKALRFGLGDIQSGQELNNAQRIRQELNDLQAVIELLDDSGVISKTPCTDAITAKKLKVAKYMEHARSNGAIT